MRTYHQFAASAHARGGQTQTEATATIADAALRKNGRSRVGRALLGAMLDALQWEAEICQSEEQYAVVRAQIVRVREALGLFVSKEN